MSVLCDYAGGLEVFSGLQWQKSRMMVWEGGKKKMWLTGVADFRRCGGGA